MEGRVRGKRAAFAAGALCLAVLGIAAFVLKDRVLERWYLHRLEKCEASEARGYGEKLAGIAGTHTVPGLLGILGRNEARILDEEDPLSGAFFAVAAAIGPEGFAAVSGALGEDRREEARTRWLAMPGERIRPVLLACLGHPAPSARIEAVRCLRGNDEELPEDVEPSVLPLLDDPDPDVRAQAAIVLATRRSGDRAVRRELRAAFGRPIVRLRRDAAELFRGWWQSDFTGMAREEIVTGLRDPDGEIRKACAWALGFLSDGAEAVPALLEAVRDPGIAYDALTAIGNLAIGLPRGDRALAPAVPILIDHLGHPEEEVRNAALFALGNIGKPHAEAAVGRVLASWKEGEEPEWVRLEFLAKMEAAPERVVPLVLKRIGDRNEGADPRTWAIWALKANGVPPEGRTLVLEMLD